MHDDRYNSLILSGLLIGGVLLAATFVTACDSSAQVIFQGLCSLLGGAIGAGGAALAVYLTLNWQEHDQKKQALIGIYDECSNYIRHGIAYHGIFRMGLEGDEKIKDYMFVGVLKAAFTFPAPIFFPSMISNLTRLREPSLVTDFYRNIESLNQKAIIGSAETHESSQLTAVQMRYAVLSLVLFLRSALALLKSSDFLDAEFASRENLIKSIENEIAKSPAASITEFSK